MKDVINSFWEVVAEDMRAARLLEESAHPTRMRLVKKVIWAAFFHPSFMCVFAYRVNRHWYLRGPRMLARLLNARRKYWFGNDVSMYADIGPGLYLPHLSDIVIGTGAVVGRRVIIFNGVTLGTRWMHDKKMPRVGDRVVIGTGAKLLGDITVGNDCVIGALSFCNTDVPAGSTMYGIPPNQIIKPHHG